MPASTYRLQISPDFTLHDATHLVPYLRTLGVDWLYLSPLLQAEQGSQHGYDVTDPTRVDESRGGPEGLDELAIAAHAAGLGILVDIVPNHMGVATPRANAWWWDVLARGDDSPYAEHFDIDWASGGGRLRLPILGDGPDELDALRVEGDELVYYEHRLPIADGTAEGTPREVHDRQHYELISWRRADHELNYRRFFAVNTLAGVRVEDERVFTDTHREIGRWIAAGQVDGLRVDHPDGLRAPGDYLRRLAELAGRRPIWVEKILEGDERMPDDWPVAGTTGYEALAVVDRVFVDVAGEEPLRALAAERAGAALDWDALVRERKREVGSQLLNSEIRRVARELAQATGDRADATTEAPERIEAALIELAAAMPVYRSYLPYGHGHLEEAAAKASATAPELASPIERLVRLLGDPEQPAALRFQQTTGMIMAKGVEDNAFYRWATLTSLAEVGGDPDRFALTPDGFHAAQQDRLARSPGTLTALTTHDTKRSEDTRARIAVIAEAPERWRRFLDEVGALAATGDGTLDNLVWQAVVGAWPASRERLEAYALKAARESGASTTWTDPDEGFEARLTGLIRAAVEDDRVRALVEAVVAEFGPAGYVNGLGMKLLQLLAPGGPDVYQGTERWDRSLVDPDNRRPVDFDESARLLERIDTGWRPPVDDTGAAKLLLVSRALRLRRDRPELFTSYRAVTAEGPAAAHLIGFDRGGVRALATRLPLGLAARGGWADTVVDLGADPLRDELTGREFSGATRVAGLFSEYPIAILVVTA